MQRHIDRRDFLKGLGIAAAGYYFRPVDLFGGTSVPTAPVAVAKCATYGPEVRTTLATMFDQLGGLSRLVKGKTVAVKVNLTGTTSLRINGLPPELTHWVHPEIIGSTVSLLDQAGARRIRILESTLTPAESFEEFLLEAKWNPRDLLGAAPRVELENTNYPGPGGKYVRLPIPGGGLLFKAYDVNHSYLDCDVYVSLAKLKEHSHGGVTLSMKNSAFGIPPCTIYGDGAGTDEPSKIVHGARMMLHDGKRQPSKTSLPEIDPTSSRDHGYRVPRVTAELAAARPIHLAIIDGIDTMAGGEGPWIPGTRHIRPGVLVAGTNCVTTDAVGTALMGFDPMAERGTVPFEGCDSMLKLAEGLGLGTRDLRRIEVLGTPISKAQLDFRHA